MVAQIFALIFFITVTAAAVAPGASINPDLGHKSECNGSNKMCPIPQEEEHGCALIPETPMKGQVSGLAAFQYGRTDPNGPLRWSNLNCKTGKFANFSNCSYCDNTCDGNFQSPIDVQSKLALRMPKDKAPIIDLSCNAKVEYEITPNNFELVCKTEGTCGTVSIDGNSFELINVHMHHFSEHDLDGFNFPLEMHLVHKHGSDLLVLALFYEQSIDCNPELQKFLDIGANRCFGNLNLENLVAASVNPKDIISYVGSTTTPPCSEGRRWFVSIKPIKACKEQIDQFNSLEGNQTENRPMQPLNGRQLITYVG